MWVWEISPQARFRRQRPVDLRQRGDPIASLYAENGWTWQGGDAGLVDDAKGAVPKRRTLRRNTVDEPAVAAYISMMGLNGMQEMAKSRGIHHSLLSTAVGAARALAARDDEESDASNIG